MHTRKVQAIVLIALTLVGIWAVGASSQQQSSEYCSSCHTVAAESWQESGHASVGCYDCHAKPGLKGWIRSKLDLQRMIRVSKQGGQPSFAMEFSSESCVGCHTKALTISETDAMRMPHGLHDSVGVDCYSCHKGLVHGPDGQQPVGMTHDTCIECHEGWISDEESCMKCHKSYELAETDTMIIPHGTHAFMNCGTCHGAMAPPEAVGAREMSHDTCIQCHEDIISDVNQCGVCHKPVAVAATDTMIIPHDTHGFMQCGQCHGPQAPAEAAAAFSMSHDTCIECHADEIGDIESCMECHKVSLVAETNQMKIPHEVHASMNCGTCHGPQAPESAVKAYSMSHSTCIECHADEISDTKACNTCHKSSTVTKTAELKIPHASHAKMSCGSCHGPQAPAKAKAAYSMSHDTCIKCHSKQIADSKQCGMCHIASSVKGTDEMNIPHKAHTKMSCGSCHGPQAPAAAKAAYTMSHDTCVKCHADLIGNTRRCGTCHASSDVKQTEMMNIPHNMHANMQCGSCHGPQAPAAAEAAYTMGHDTCVDCHGRIIGDTKSCGVCHRASDVEATAAFNIPHAYHSWMECGDCHGPQTPPSAEAAYSMTHGTCVQCHEGWLSDVKACEKCHKVPAIDETDELKIPHELHSSMATCGTCHGPMAPAAARDAWTINHDVCAPCHDMEDYDACQKCHKW